MVHGDGLIRNAKCGRRSADAVEPEALARSATPVRKPPTSGELKAKTEWLRLTACGINANAIAVKMVWNW